MQKWPSTNRLCQDLRLQVQKAHTVGQLYSVCGQSSFGGHVSLYGGTNIDSLPSVGGYNDISIGGRWMTARKKVYISGEAQGGEQRHTGKICQDDFVFGALCLVCNIPRHPFSVNLAELPFSVFIFLAMLKPF